MAIKILQIDLQNDITPQIGSYDNAGGVTPNNWLNEGGVYSLGPTNVDGRTPYYWFTPTREVTDFDLCWEDYQDRTQTTAQYHLEIGDSAGNVVLSALRANANYYIGPVNVGSQAYQTWHKILIEVRKASANSSTVTAYVDGKKIASGTSDTLLTSAKVALLGHVPGVGHWQNAGQRLRYVTIYDRSYTSKGVNLDGMMTTITGLISKLRAKLSAVAFTGSYNDLSDKPTISTVNDGTLTIQKNGSNVATFTANQSTAATANITVPTAVSELTNDSGYLTSSSNLDASKLTSGTVDIARLPQGALERLIKVANEAARYALTTADVQLGDTVQQLDTGIMYVVTDTDHLDNAAGYTEYTAGTAASVPWSGVTGKPAFAAVATSGAYSDLTGTPAIPTVNDATLTIQQNGTAVDSFTANSSSDKTVNIQCVDLASNQTVGGNKEFTGTTTAHDVIPSATNTYNLGSSSYQWDQAYIKSLIINGVACGDILTHNASEFVDLTSNQTIGGTKIFRNEVTMFGRDINLMSRLHYGKNSNPSSTCWHYVFFRGNTATEGYTDAWYSGFLEQYVDTTGVARGRWLVRDTSENAVALELWASGNDKQVRPAQNNTTDLGTPTNKWKSFNGINPGALSLWSDNYISLDTTSFDVTATTIGTFTPTADGWATLVIGQKNKPFGIWLIGGTIRESFYSVKNNDDYFVFALIPVRANVGITIYCTAADIDSTRNIGWLRLSPCQGNV